MGHVDLTPEQEIEFAAKLHHSFLPTDLNNNFLDTSTTNLPLKQIGGDYHSIMQLNDNTTIIGICDVTGHSMTSALLAARINTFVTTQALEGAKPCELIDGLNEYLCKRISNTGTFTGFGCLYISHDTNEIIYGGAALPPLLHYSSATKQVKELTSETIFLGAVHPLPVECEFHRTQISSGDKLILCTDGVIEAENRDMELWGIEPVIDILQNFNDRSSAQLNDLIMHSLYEYSDNKLNDDLTLISVNIK